MVAGKVVVCWWTSHGGPLKVEIKKICSAMLGCVPWCLLVRLHPIASKLRVNKLTIDNRGKTNTNYSLLHCEDPKINC